MPAELLHVLDQHAGSVNCVRFTHDGAYCMTASDDRTIKLWNPHKTDPRSASSTPSSSAPRALCVQTYGGVHGYKVLDVAISGDKTKFFSAGDDRTCFLWDVAGNRVIRKIQAHAHRTNAVLFNHDDSVVMTASYDQSVKCWDLRSNNKDPIQVMSDFKDSVTTLARTPTAILAGSVDGHVRIYDLRMGCMHADNLGEPITSLRVSGDDKMYLTACLGSRLRLLDLSSGRLLRDFTGHIHEGLKTEAAFVSDDLQVVAGSEDGSIYHWHLLKGSITDITDHAHGPGGSTGSRTIGGSSSSSRGRSGGVSSVVYHPTESNVFLSAGYDGVVKCWRSTHSI